MQKDTIFALSTPQGVGGVAVIRISGPQAQAALQALFQPAGTSPMEPRKLIYGRFVFDGTQIDDGMAVLFCAPASYTGEDSAELHCHGSLAVVQQLLGVCALRSQASLQSVLFCTEKWIYPKPKP